MLQSDQSNQINSGDSLQK